MSSPSGFIGSARSCWYTHTLGRESPRTECRFMSMYCGTEGRPVSQPMTGEMSAWVRVRVGVMVRVRVRVRVRAEVHVAHGRYLPSSPSPSPGTNPNPKPSPTPTPSPRPNHPNAHLVDVHVAHDCFGHIEPEGLGEG